MVNIGSKKGCNIKLIQSLGAIVSTACSTLENIKRMTTVERLAHNASLFALNTKNMMCSLSVLFQHMNQKEYRCNGCVFFISLK